MKILILDIETSPLLVDAWGLWDVNVGLNQIHKPTRMICFAAKWYGEKKIEFWSEHHHGRAEMVQAIWDLLNEADCVIHFNGASFDIPHINREFLLDGLGPPAPFKQIDLLRVIKRNFKFPSNKLAYITVALGLETKVSHEGHALWTACLAGDDKAWERMKRYNKKDVEILEPLYDILLPWITTHPNVFLYADGSAVEGCPNCGSLALRKEGFAFTLSGKFQRFCCKGCGAWSKSSKRLGGTTITGLAR